MGETIFSLVRDGNLIAYKSADLREHVLNATGLETPSGGVRMVKGKTSKKIDGAISLAMAAVAAVQMPAIDLSRMALIGKERIMSRSGWDEDDGGTIGERFDRGEFSRRWDW